MISRGFCLAIMALIMIPWASDAFASHRGWYVIMGSFHYQDTNAAERRARDIANRCGLDVYWQDAIEIYGMNPDVLFVYQGPYHQKSQAQAILREARTCVRDSYIKKGQPK